MFTIILNSRSLSITLCISLNSLPNTDDSTPYHKFSVDREQRWCIYKYLYTVVIFIKYTMYFQERFRVQCYSAVISIPQAIFRSAIDACASVKSCCAKKSMNCSMELPFNLAKPNDYLAKNNLVVSVLIQACMYIQCMYEYMVHPHCGLFWEGGGLWSWWGTWRILDGGRGLNGEKGRCDCICKMISLKICNNFKFE